MNDNIYDEKKKCNIYVIISILNFYLIFLAYEIFFKKLLLINFGIHRVFSGPVGLTAVQGSHQKFMVWLKIC